MDPSFDFSGVVPSIDRILAYDPVIRESRDLNWHGWITTGAMVVELVDENFGKDISALAPLLLYTRDSKAADVIHAVK